MYPIEKGDHGFWFVWSMQPQHVIGGEARAKGLETFPTYGEGRDECLRRNQQIKANE